MFAQFLVYKEEATTPIKGSSSPLFKNQNMSKYLHILLLFTSLSTLSNLAMATAPPHQNPYNPFSLETPSELVDLVYHMGPVVAASPTNLYLIWYGSWDAPSQSIIRDFLLSLSSAAADGKNSSSSAPPTVAAAVASPSVADWWRSTACLYTDQTGANVTSGFALAREYRDAAYSHGASLSRLAVQSVIRSAVTGYPERLPLDPYNGVYLVLTSPDVRVEDFCREVCGFHYFTFSAIVGVTVPFAWVGHSGVQCPGMCAFPFALPEYMGGGEGNGSTAGDNNLRALVAPNGDVGVDGMISVIGHELAEMASNPLINAWFAGGDPAAPTEIADLCEGVYGTGGGGGYVGSVYKGEQGEGYNLNGVNGRRFLVQWLWNPVSKSCFGPNALN